MPRKKCGKVMTHFRKFWSGHMPRTKCGRKPKFPTQRRPNFGRLLGAFFVRNACPVKTTDGEKPRRFPVFRGMFPENLFTRIPYFTSLSGNIHLLCRKTLTDRYLEPCPRWQKDPVLLFSEYGFRGNNPKKTPALSLCQNDHKNRRKVTWKLLISTLNSSKC